jgi:hypothetical protein
LEFGGVGEIIGTESSRSGGMKGRIAIWASVGFLVACYWITLERMAVQFYETPYLPMAVRELSPEGYAFIYPVAVTSCPVVFARRYLHLHFWWVPAMNAAAYAVIGLIAEILRRKSNPSLAT